MLKGKIDIKVIFILILAAALILSFIFRPSNGIENYEDEIKALKEENVRLLLDNDSLAVENGKKDIEIEKYLLEIDSTQVLLDENNDKIKDLEDGKDKVSGYVSGLNANGVAESLTDYLNRK